MSDKRVLYKNPTNAIFTTYKQKLPLLRAAIMKSHSMNKPIKISKFYTEHKLTPNLTQILIKLGVVRRTKEAPASEGTYLDWVYKSEGNEGGEIDTQLIQSLLKTDYEISKEKRDTAKQGTKIITTAVVKSTKFDPDNATSQIHWLNEKLQKEEATPGYLRPDEKEMYQQIIHNLNSMHELRETLPKILGSLTSLNDRIRN